MKTIIICCSAGMSTSLFVQKLKQYAENINEFINIFAISITEIDNYLDKAHVIVLAPQIRFLYKTITEKTTKPVINIEMRDYGTMNVQKVLPEILAALRN